MLRTVAALILDALLFTGAAEVLLQLMASTGPATSTLEARSAMLGDLGTVPALACLVLLAVATPLPTMRLGIVSLGILWAAYGAAPLFLWLPEGVSAHLLWGGVRLVCVGLLLQWMLRTAGRPWLLSTDLQSLRPRARRRVAALSLVALFGIPLLAAGYAVVAILAWLQLATQGFVSFDLAGVDLADRRYTRGDQEVRLVGMMHVGERDRYRELVKSFIAEDTVVLYEGVTDDQQLMDASIDYAGAASALGLEAQHDLESYLEDIEPAEVEGVSLAEWPVLRHADLDMSQFSAQTRAFVARAASLWRSESLVDALSDYLRWFEAEGGDELFGVIEEDLIERRNAHLLSEMGEAFVEFDRVVVPWGALHLPGIERSLLSGGFSEVERSEHRLILWITLLAR